MAATKAAVYFQLARATLVLLAVAVALALLSPKEAGEPLLPLWQWALLGIGFWGFLWSVIAYFGTEGHLTPQRFLATMAFHFGP